MILVIDKRDITVRHKEGCLVLQRKGKKDRQIPIRPLEQVVMYGNPLVEAAAFRVLGEAAVPVVMMAARGKQRAAILGSGLATQLPLRRLQHRLAEQPATSLALAKWFVGQKMVGYDLPLAALDQLYTACREDRIAFQKLRDVSLEKLAAAVSLASATGLEGQLAHAWFALLAKHLPFKWKFAGRNRRPPRDPVNALLSLGYTLLLSEVRRGVQVAGFDPSLGFLHKDHPGRESLALDFTEIFRAGVDYFMLRWINSGQIDSNDFYYRKKDGCRLVKSARPRFYQAWAQYREEWPRPVGLLDGEPDIRRGSLRELINGQTSNAREYMKRLEWEHGTTTAGTGHGAGSIEHNLA